MEMTLVDGSVVLVAHQFNPAIIDKHWLIKHGIVTEDDILSGGIYIPHLSRMNTKDFRLTVFPEQLQFSPVNPNECSQEQIRNILGGIVERLPETPYMAAGINFLWHLTPDVTMQAFTRRLFYQERKVHEFFDTLDGRYGAYFSKEIFGTRLKLDIKPITIKKENALTETLRCSFNYHKDLVSEDKVTEILETIHVDYHQRQILARFLLGLENVGELFIKQQTVTQLGHRIGPALFLSMLKFADNLFSFRSHTM